MAKYSITTNEAIRHVMSKCPGRVLTSYQVTDLIRRTFSKNEKYATVGRQLRRMTNEESNLFPWVTRVADNSYLYIENPISLYSLLEPGPDLSDISNQELLKELKRRLK